MIFVRNHSILLTWQIKVYDLQYAILYDYNRNNFVLCSLFFVLVKTETQFKQFLGSMANSYSSFTLKYILKKEHLKRKMRTNWTGPWLRFIWNHSDTLLSLIYYLHWFAFLIQTYLPPPSYTASPLLRLWMLIIFLNAKQQKNFLQAWRTFSVPFHPSLLSVTEVELILIMEFL